MKQGGPFIKRPLRASLKVPALRSARQFEQILKNRQEMIELGSLARYTAVNAAAASGLNSAGLNQYSTGLNQYNPYAAGPSGLGSNR